ncbi:alpha/beta hydrolase [Chitinophaga caeni]|uniref:Alpha/beta hydrolase n=1 Tax=Chitinophaga caeni TaxID=2029983 RepID=A0A291R108_9BACT|nr:alpha/beta hydrolase [Chitinophaga caeni]ATL49887.1 alpha/beta hydrolase [Chitinophaga caeni]
MNKRQFASFLPALFSFIIIAVSCQQGPQSSSGTDHEKNDSSSVKATAAPVDKGYAEVNGLKMYYEVYGKGQPIVLLHGSFMTIPLNWSKVIPQLAANRQVIVAEMQGHGRTKDIDREFSYENMADDVSGLLKHLKVDSADVLGYSMGAGIAFQFAIRHPEQLRRLIVLSGTYSHDGWWPDVEESFKHMNAEMFKGSPIEQQYDSLGNDPAQFENYIKKIISADTKSYDWTKEAKNIKAPIFMIIGDDDGVRYEHAIELFKAKGGGKMGDLHGLPASRLAILPGTTHIGMIQHADWWIPMVTDFLDSDLSPTPPMTF